jgi:hypothetical protein
MAIRADFNVNVATMRGAGRKQVAAGAVNADFMIIRMNGCLHDALKPFCKRVILAEKLAFPQPELHFARLLIVRHSM